MRYSTLLLVLLLATLLLSTPILAHDKKQDILPSTPGLNLQVIKPVQLIIQPFILDRISISTNHTQPVFIQLIQ